MQKLLAQNRLAIGCIDTWLFARLSDGKTFVTEPSSISSTGLYDPFLVSGERLCLLQEHYQKFRLGDGGFGLKPFLREKKVFLRVFIIF